MEIAYDHFLPILDEIAYSSKIAKKQDACLILALYYLFISLSFTLTTVTAV